jgi:Domain of unknown function (DUF1707)
VLPDPPPLRASDRDREAVVGLLAQASVDGRLTVEELAERAGLANGARTYDELKAITADLGSAAHVAPGAHGGAVAAAPVERHRAILSSLDRRGRWRLAPRNRFVTVLGSIHLDLRQALLPGPEVEIELVSTLGSALLLVPAGADVRVSGGNALGSCELHLGADAPTAGAPVIHVIVGGALGSVEVRSEPRLGERLKQEAKRLARRLIEPPGPSPRL